MLLLGLGAGIAFNPVLLAAMSDVAPSESGLASGVVNTSFMMGGALGLAVLASLAAARTEGFTASGAPPLVALNGGYQTAFFVGAIFALAACAIGAWFFRTQAAPARPRIPMHGAWRDPTGGPRSGASLTRCTRAHPFGGLKRLRSRRRCWTGAYPRTERTRR